MTIEVLANRLGVSEDRAKSILFHVVDYLIEQEPSDDVLDCGLWHNHQHNSTKNMVESYKAMLWASFEELDGQKVDKPGPFLMFDLTDGKFYLEHR